MVGNTGTIMTMRLVRSKLRKREETSPAAAGVGIRSNSSGNNCYHQDQQIFPTASLADCNNHNNNNNIIINTSSIEQHQQQPQEVAFTRTSGVGTPAASNWVFPPKAPTPNIYNCLDNNALVAENGKNGFKGFRKQFSGRFKRLVTTKKADPMPAIPPELRPQLKTIYVY